MRYIHSLILLGYSTIPWDPSRGAHKHNVESAMQSNYFHQHLLFVLHDRRSTFFCFPTWDMLGLDITILKKKKKVLEMESNMDGLVVSATLQQSMSFRIFLVAGYEACRTLCERLRSHNKGWFGAVKGVKARRAVPPSCNPSGCVIGAQWMDTWPYFALN